MQTSLAAPVKTKKENEAAASSTGDPPKRPKAKAKSEAASVLPTPSPNPMPTRTTRKAKVGREDHLHPLTRRRFSVTTSSIKEDATKVTNVFTVILRRSMMPR